MLQLPERSKTIIKKEGQCWAVPKPWLLSIARSPVICCALRKAHTLKLCRLWLALGLSGSHLVSVLRKCWPQSGWAHCPLWAHRPCAPALFIPLVRFFWHGLLLRHCSSFPLQGDFTIKSLPMDICTCFSFDYRAGNPVWRETHLHIACIWLLGLSSWSSCAETQVPHQTLSFQLLDFKMCLCMQDVIPGKTLQVPSVPFSCGFLKRTWKMPAS